MMGERATYKILLMIGVKGHGACLYVNRLCYLRRPLPTGRWHVFVLANMLELFLVYILSFALVNAHQDS